MKAFELHSLVKLTSRQPEINADSVNCTVHSDKPVKVFCFDYETLR